MVGQEEGVVWSPFRRTEEAAEDEAGSGKWQLLHWVKEELAERGNGLKCAEGEDRIVPALYGGDTIENVSAWQVQEGMRPSGAVTRIQELG